MDGADYKLCYGCMRKLPLLKSKCDYCGWDDSVRHNVEDVLPEGTELHGKYLVGRMLGQGGFGVTYLGFDKVLQIRVAIKEYFPMGFCMRSSQTLSVVSRSTGAQNGAFAKGCEAFLDEARTLAKFNSPYIVRVQDFFRENDTAYIVMAYVDGITLQQAMKQAGGRLPADHVLYLMKPLIHQLGELHRENIIHRDIKPDNLMLVKDANGEHLVLLDFGAARTFVSNQTKGMTRIATPGYAPVEQFIPDGQQGPYTDVYALCATIYKAITGVLPPSAIERSAKGVPLNPISTFGITVSGKVEAALRHGLAVNSADRTQTMKQLYEELYQNGNQIDGIYQRAMNLLQEAKNARDVNAKANIYRSAATLFEQIKGYRDSANRIEECEREIDNIAGKNTIIGHASDSPGKIKDGSNGKKPKKKKKIFIWILILLILLAGVLGWGYINGWFDGQITPIPTPTQEQELTTMPTQEATLEITDTLVPTSTPEPTAEPTDSPTLVPTDTPTLEPTGTPVPTDTPEPTDTPTPEPTNTPLPTDTPELTDTPTPVPTDTPSPTNTPELTEEPTNTQTPVLTDTPTLELAGTSTNSPEQILEVGTIDHDYLESLLIDVKNGVFEQEDLEALLTLYYQNASNKEVLVREGLNYIYDQLMVMETFIPVSSSEPTDSPIPTNIQELASGTIPLDSEHFPDDHFRKYIQDKYDDNHDGVLSQEEKQGVKRIFCSYMEITSLQGVELFNDLKLLDCRGNQLTSLDISKNESLEDLDCEFNQLTDLDVSKNEALKKLYCGHNQLTSLDVSSNISIEDLHCSVNQLSGLDVSKNEFLEDLYCNDNQIISIDVTQNQFLQRFNCDNNQLTSINVNQNDALIWLFCDNNQLTSIDVSQNESLLSFYCSNNQLTSLDVSNNTKLLYLSCEGNLLSSIDIRNNTKLEKLNCKNNEITAIDISNCKDLKEFECDDNVIVTESTWTNPDSGIEVSYEPFYLFAVVTEEPNEYLNSLVKDVKSGTVFQEQLETLLTVHYQGAANQEILVKEGLDYIKDRLATE